MREGYSLKRRLRHWRMTCGVLGLGMMALASYQANAQFTFTGIDVGGPLQFQGLFQDNGGGNLALFGGGGDIWNASDQCFFYYTPVKDAIWDASVQVQNLQYGNDAWGKAELMARQDDGTGVPKGPDPFIAMMTTRTGGTPAGQNEIQPQFRSARGAGADSMAFNPVARPNYPYTWLRLTRNGTLFTGYYATNSTGAPQWIAFPTVFETAGGRVNNSTFSAWTGPVTLGVAVTSHNNTDQSSTEADISNLSVTVANGLAIMPPNGTPIGFTITVAKSGTATPNASTLEIKLDGTVVTTTSAVSPDGYYTTYTFANSASPLVVGASHTVDLTIKDTANVTYTKSQTFVVPYYKTIPAAAALVASTVDKTKPGFRIRIHQASTDQGNSDDRTEGQLSGGSGPNIADTSAYVNGYATEPSVINYNNWVNVDPISAVSNQIGNFTNDMAFPSIGAVNTNNFVAEILTVLEFPAPGLYTMIVNSDDGFKVSALIPGEDPKDKNLRAGIFEGGRGSSDTSFQIYLQQAGLYGFRTTYEQGNGGGNLEWIILDSTGKKVLINAADSVVKAYAKATAIVQPPYFEAATPSGPAEPQNITVNVVIANADSTVNSGSLTMKFDGATVSPTITPLAGGKIQASYTPPILGQSSTHTVQVSFTESGGSTVSKTWEFGVAGAITFRMFLNINGNGDVPALTSFAGYTANTPDIVSNAPAISVNDGTVNWGIDYIGYFMPTATTNYTFYISADDNAELWLSTDESPANVRRIANEPSWSNYREWLTREGGSGLDASMKHSSPLALVKGQKYFLHALAKQGGGGGNLAVTWWKPGDPAIATDQAAKSVGLVPFGGVAAYVTGPATLNIVQGRPLVLLGGAFAAQGQLTYQWMKNGVAIPDATGTTIKSHFAGTGDSGTYVLRATAGAPLNQTVSSAPVVVSVVADTVAPVPTAGAVLNYSGTFQVGVSFDEAVDPATLVQANFTLSSGTVTAFNVVTNSWLDYTAVKLDTTGLTPGTTYTVTVKGVKDLAGNQLAQQVLSFKANAAFAWAETGSPAVKGTVVPVGDNGFDILTGGRTEWGSYDEIGMAYMVKTGDFDVRVQVVDAEFASQWARAGIQARNNMNVGMASDGTDGSAYAQLHANPSQTLAYWWDPNDPVQPANQTPNNNFEQNCRLGTGGPTQGWGTGGGGPPLYPNVWLRLKRTGDEIFGFRSTDGQAWTAMGSVTLTNILPTMYVGPEFAVETGNIFGTQAGDGVYEPLYDRLYTAKFRNFSDTPTSVPPSTISQAKIAAGLHLYWSAGVLQQSSALGATANWADVSGVTGTNYNATLTGSGMFFRLRGQ